MAAIEVAQATEVKSYSDIMKGAIEKEKTKLKIELVGLVQCKVADVKTDKNDNAKEMEQMVAKAVANKSDEDNDVERRKSNIIKYRVEESSSDEAETRKSADTVFFKELFEGPLALEQFDETYANKTTIRGIEK